ncbi:hypothetical protein OHW39_09235 [Acinetobacter baumannii]|nr:hypothetical protein [Acinetobacter baumannii]
MSQNQDKSKQQPTQQNPSSGQQEQAQIKNNPQVQHSLNNQILNSQKIITISLNKYLVFDSCINY